MIARRHLLTGAHVAVGVLMACATLLEALSYRASDWSHSVALLAAAALVAVVVARWVPLLGLACVVAAMVVPPLLTVPNTGAGGSQLIVLMLLTGLVAYQHRMRVSVPAWAAAALLPSSSAVLEGAALWELVFFSLFLGTAWTLGTLLRRESGRSAELARLGDELAAEQERRAETAVLAERTRIAQELHDALAHDVSVMTLQVGVVRRRLAALPVEQDTLRDAEELGRRAMEELRSLVGIMRRDGDLAPAPSLSRLAELCARVRAAGSPVDLECDLEPGFALPPEVDRAAYRIVQESLTNALKHAPGAPVQVRVARTKAGVSVTVRTAGVGRVAGAGGGLGVPGMHERAASVGGTLEVADVAGSHVVTARLPLLQDREPVR